MLRRLILWILLAVGLAAPGLAAAPTSMQVQVEQTPMRESPSFLGRVVATVTYGDSLPVIQSARGWIQVRTPDGTVGWLHESALTAKKVTLKSGAGSVQTTADTREVALAGKGFSESVEKQYQAENQILDFTWLDRMDSFAVPEQAKIDFLKQGGLQP